MEKNNLPKYPDNSVLAGAHTVVATPLPVKRVAQSNDATTSTQASKFPCDFKAAIPTSNWKQAHLQWPPDRHADWPGGRAPIHAASKLLMDASTGKVYFVGTDGKVYNYYWDGNTAWDVEALVPGQSALIDAVGGLVIDGDKIFCIGTDKKVYNFYYQNNTWQFDVLVPSQWVLIDATGGLAVDHAGHVFAIGTDHKVCNFYYSNNGWGFGPLVGNQWVSIDPEGGLMVDQLGKVYCVGTDKKVYNFYYTSNAWQFAALVPNQYASIAASGGIVLDNAGHVFAVGTDGKVYNYYWMGSAWDFAALNDNQYAHIDPRGKLVIDGLGRIYGIATDGKVYNYYWSGNNWSFDALQLNAYEKADPIGGMALKDDHVFVIGQNGKIYNYYWMGVSWGFDILSPSQPDNARATNKLAVADSVYFSTIDGHLEALYYADGQINYNDWLQVYGEDFSSIDIPALKNDWTLHLPWGHAEVAGILGGWEFGYCSENAFSISGGNLHVTANNQPIWARLVDWQADTDIMSDGNPNYREFYFTGGSMTSKASYLFGLFEVYGRVPAGKGFWPAFWLTGSSSWPPEIDVFEFDGTHTDTCSNNIHWRIDADNTGSCGMQYVTPIDLTAGYHKYSMAWYSDRIVFYFDDHELRTVDHHIPQTPMLVIVGMGVGLSHPDSSTPFPSNFDVDYIRIYQHK